MNSIPWITVTGIDERCDPAELLRLLRQYPRLELGILYTVSPDGRHRYPRYGWIREVLGCLQRCALHVCGTRARAELYEGSSRIGALVEHATRVQVNGLVHELELARVCQRWPHTPVITQYTPLRETLLGVDALHHQVLVDASGGEGRLPDAWKRPFTNKPVGFAGGLGPHNLATHLPLIADVAREPWWVDMEGRLRDESDWFHLGSAERAAEIVHEFREARE